MNRERELEDLVVDALAGDAGAQRLLIDGLAPIIQRRVGHALLRAAAGRRQRGDLRQNVEDFVQEVFAALFDRNAAALRSWDGKRGMSLKNFVGLIAEHQAASILRTGKRNPWIEEPTICEDIDRVTGGAETTYSGACSRELLAKLLDRLRAELTPRGLELFQLLWVEDRTTAEISERMKLHPDAVYTWRSRITKVVHRLYRELEAEAPAPAAASVRIRS